MGCLYRSDTGRACIHSRLTIDQRPTRKRCHDCEFYEPPYSLETRCALLANEGTVCPKPYSECPDCPHFRPEGIASNREPFDPKRYAKEYRDRNREKLNEKQRERRARNREDYNRYQKQLMKDRRRYGKD